MPVSYTHLDVYKRQQQPNNLLVKMTNHAPQTTEQVRISILIDGQEKPIRVGDFEAGSTMIDTIPVVLKSRGAHKITLKISDYPVQFDDEYHVALHVPDTIIALNICLLYTSRCV